MIFDAREFERSRLKRALIRVARDPELLVLQQIQFQILTVEDVDDLRLLRDRDVAEAAAPADRYWQRLAVKTGRSIELNLVIRVKFQFFRDVQVAVAPVKREFDRRLK